MATIRCSITGLLCIFFLASLLVSSEAFFGNRVGGGKRFVEQPRAISRDICQLALQQCLDSQQKSRDEEVTNERPEKRNMKYFHQWSWNGLISSRRHWLRSNVFWNYKDSLCFFLFKWWESLWSSMITIKRTLTVRTLYIVMEILSKIVI